jgi:hypothetical protein
MHMLFFVAADVPEGGETAFPDSSHWVDSSLPGKLGPFSPCARGAVAFKPRKVRCAADVPLSQTHVVIASAPLLRQLNHGVGVSITPYDTGTLFQMVVSTALHCALLWAQQHCACAPSLCVAILLYVLCCCLLLRLPPQHAALSAAALHLQ